MEAFEDDEQPSRDEDTEMSDCPLPPSSAAGAFGSFPVGAGCEPAGMGIADWGDGGDERRAEPPQTGTAFDLLGQQTGGPAGVAADAASGTQVHQRRGDGGSEALQPSLPPGGGSRSSSQQA